VGLPTVRFVGKNGDGPSFKQGQVEIHLPAPGRWGRKGSQGLALFRGPEY